MYKNKHTHSLYKSGVARAKKSAAIALTLTLMAGLCTGCGNTGSDTGAVSGDAASEAGTTSGTAAEATPAFHGIDAPEMAQRLGDICSSEGISYEPAALDLIARFIK